MTTRLNKPVARETGATHDGRPIIVMLSPDGIVLREKGRRTAHVVPYRDAFGVAATQSAAEAGMRVCTAHHGELIVSIGREGIQFRQAGRNKTFLLGHGYAFQTAVNLHVEAERAERRRRKGRGR